MEASAEKVEKPWAVVHISMWLVLVHTLGQGYRQKM